MLTSRIDQLKKQFFTHVPAVCLEGALSKTHVFKETEGEPMIVRRAKAFKRHCETKTITIISIMDRRPRAPVFLS